MPPTEWSHPVDFSDRDRGGSGCICFVTRRGRDFALWLKFLSSLHALLCDYALCPFACHLQQVVTGGANLHGIRIHFPQVSVYLVQFLRLEYTFRKNFESMTNRSKVHAKIASTFATPKSQSCELVTFEPDM